jgi:hypothetical protein
VRGNFATVEQPRKVLSCELTSHFSLFTISMQIHTVVEKNRHFTALEKYKMPSALEILLSKTIFASSYIVAIRLERMTHTRESVLRSLLSLSLAHFSTLGRQTDTRSVRSDFASAAWPLRHYKSLKAYLGALFVSPLNIQYFFFILCAHFIDLAGEGWCPRKTHTHEARRNFASVCARFFSLASKSFCICACVTSKGVRAFFFTQLWSPGERAIHMQVANFLDNEREISRGARLESCKLRTVRAPVYICYIASTIIIHHLRFWN